MKNRNEQILEFVERSNGVTNAQIALAVGIASNDVATRTLQMLQKGKVSRVEYARTPSNKPMYRYLKATKTLVLENKALDNENKKQKPKKQQVVDSLDGLVELMASRLVSNIVDSVRRKLPLALEEVLAVPAPVYIPEVAASAAPVVAHSEPKEVLVDTREAIAKLSKPKPAKQVETRQPIIGVVGLLPVQNGEIHAEFSDCMELRYADGHQTNALRALADRCDVVFAHTNHLPHSADEILKNAKCFKRVSGGLSNMKDALLKYFIDAKA